MSNPGLVNLKPWWKLNETSGIRYDANGYVNLTQVGGVGYAVGHQTFTGNGADFVVPGPEYLYSTDPSNHLRGGSFPISIGAWIKPHALGPDPDILSKWGQTDADQEYILHSVDSIIRFTVRDSFLNYYYVLANTFGTLSNDIWYFISAYYDEVASEIGVGVNNVWNTYGSDVYGINPGSADFYLARRDETRSPSTYYDGQMDEVFFYSNRLLDSNEWTWLYNSGYGRRYGDVDPVAPPFINIITKRKMPEIYVYNEDLVALGIIEKYSSLNWAERYNSEGDFELELPISYASSPLLDFDNFLYIPTSDKIMVIEEKKPTKTPTEGKLLVNGRSAESILRRRVLTQLHNWFGPAEYYAYHLVYWSCINPADTDREIALIEDGSGNAWPPAMASSALVTEQFVSESIYEVIETVLKRVDLGFKIVVANLTKTSSKLYFLVYEGVDRSVGQDNIPPIIFSDTFDNLLDSSFLTTQKGNINATLVVISDDPTYERVFVWEGGSDESPGGTEPSGLNRFEGRLETSIDRGGDDPAAASTPGTPTKPTLGVIGQDNLAAIGITTTPVIALKIEPPIPLTDEEVLAIIEERGETVIKDNTPLAIFDGDVDARGQFVLEEDFLLGDIVQVNAHGNSGKARIIEVVKSYSVEGEKIYMAFDFEV